MTPRSQLPGTALVTSCGALDHEVQSTFMGGEE